MSVTISNLKIENQKQQKTPELDAIVKVMEKHGVKNPYDLLPKSIKHKVSFTLNNTFSAFANALRRTLVDDIPTYSMHVEEKDVVTDDEFVSGISDVLIKNLALTPIMQSDDIMKTHELYLYVHNTTTEIIDVKARDIQIVPKSSKKKKGGAEKKAAKKKKTDTASKSDTADNSEVESEVEDDNEDKTTTPETEVEPESETDNPDTENTEDANEKDENIEDNPDSETENTHKDKTTNKPITKSNSNVLLPDDNILLIRLRPGKYLKIRNIVITQGTAAIDAGRFTLLNNVMYEPLDVTPYDQFTGKGTRSIEHDCKSFALGFTTRGNIEPKEVMEKAHKKMSTCLLDIKNKIKTYSEANAGIYYNNQDCEVTIKDEVYTFKFLNHYISELLMIAMCCYKLDDNIPYCTATVERYDSLIGILKIKHANVISVLIKSIETCQKNLDTVLAAF
jgi:hypothetical protein